MGLSIEHILRAKLIPWAGTNLSERLVVAQSQSMEGQHLPAAVSLGVYKTKGRRVVVRGKRHPGYRLFAADWPDDSLHELTVPKLVCVIDGTADYIAGKNILTCPAGHFILVPPHVPNISNDRTHLNADQPADATCDLFQIIVLKDYVHCMYSRSTHQQSFDHPELACAIYHHQAVRTFHDSMEYASLGKQHNTAVAQHLLSAFLEMLLFEIINGNIVYTLYNHAPLTPHNRSVSELHDYIRTNLRHSPTIEKMAKYLCMSPRQFTRYWRRETGQTFVESLTQCRMEEAKRLLSGTNWTIDAIAFLVGFQSASYFNTFFHKHTGFSPGQYRLKEKASPE
jgi:AraC-like DNA-binding protein